MNMRDNSIARRLGYKTVYAVSCINTVCYPHIRPEVTAVYDSWEDLWDTEGLDERAKPGASRDVPMSCTVFRGTYVKLYVDRVYVPFLKKGE